MRKLVHLSLLLFLLVFIQKAQATVGAGGYVPFVSVYQNDEKGGSNLMDMKPFVSFHSRMQIVGGLNLRPELGIVFPDSPNDSDNNRQKTTTYFGMINLSYLVFGYTYINAGAGTFFTKIESKAGQKAFSNGNSTAVYYYPGGTETSMNSTFNFGIEQGLGPNFTLSLMSYWFQILESTARSFSYSLSMNFFL